MPDRRTGRGDALWLLPAPPHDRVLAEQAEHLRSRHGGPPLLPHLTLLGGLPDPAQAWVIFHDLGQTLAPLSIPLATPAWGQRWFHCVYLHVDPHPGLWAAHERACALAGWTPEGFAPHISLLYGDLAAEERARIAAADLAAVPGPIRLDRLALVDTRGPAEVWQERACARLR